MFLEFTQANSGAGLIPGPSNVIYVDVAGSDATGARGDLARPFATMAAALAVALSGDEIVVGPGTFTGPVVLPALANLAIRGYGSNGVTVLTAAANVDVIQLNAANKAVLLNDIAVLPPAGTGRAVSGSGAVAGVNQGLWLNGTGQAGVVGLRIDDCVLGAGGVGVGVNSLDLTYANSAFVYGSIVAGAYNLVSCASVILDSVVSTTTPGAMQVTYTSTDASAPARAAGVQLFASQVGLVTLSGSPKFVADADSSVIGMTGNALTDVANASGHLAILFQGTSTGNIDFGSTLAKGLPSTATALSLVFDGSNLEGGSFIWAVVGAANTQTISAWRTLMNKGTVQAGSTAAGYTAGGSGVLIDGRESMWLLTAIAFSTPDTTGSITPPNVSLVAVPVNQAGNTSTLATNILGAGVRVSSTAYAVTATGSASAAASGAPAATAKTTTQVTVGYAATPGAGTTVDILIRFP